MIDPKFAIRLAAVTMLIIFVAGCKKSPTKSEPVPPSQQNLLVSRLSVSFVPGGSENITVIATDKAGAPETFTTTMGDAGVASVATVSDSVIRVTGVNYGKTNLTITSKSGSSVIVPVWVYNHKVLDVGELEVAYCDSFQFRWLTQTPYLTYASFYHPLPTDGFKPVGSLGFEGNYNPNGIQAVMVVKAKPGSTALAPPVDYIYAFDTLAHNPTAVATFWIPVPPAGYKALGIVVGTGRSKPSLDEVVCVREDLTTAGDAGEVFCAWVLFNTPIFVGFVGWNIDPPDAGPHEDAYLSTGTFVAADTDLAPSVHPVMNVLRIPLPLLAEAPNQTYVPKLTGYDSPPAETVPVMVKEMLVPCTIVKDALYDSSDPHWRISNSPFYRLERQVYYKLLYHNYNQTSQVQTNSVLIRSGVTTTESETYKNETAISVTVEAGISIKAFESKISATVSRSFGYETMTSVAELQEKEVSSSINTPPGKAAALWQKFNRYVLKRHNGTALEPVAAWEFGIDSYVTDEYPD